MNRNWNQVRLYIFESISPKFIIENLWKFKFFAKQEIQIFFLEKKSKEKKLAMAAFIVEKKEKLVAHVERREEEETVVEEEEEDNCGRKSRKNVVATKGQQMTPALFNDVDVPFATSPIRLHINFFYLLETKSAAPSWIFTMVVGTAMVCGCLSQNSSPRRFLTNVVSILMGVKNFCKNSLF